ncbi:hypothetical protein Tco_0810355 [Tanacetum coccineum]
MTPSHFNTYQSSYNNPQFQQQFSPSQSPQYGSIHPTQHYSTAYPSTPLAMTYLSAPYPNAYSSIVHQDAYSGLAVPVFKKGDDPIDAINKMMSFLSTVVTSRFPSTNNQLRSSSNSRQQATIHDGRCSKPKRKRDASWFRDKFFWLKNRIWVKVFVITALKNDLRKLKGKDIVDNDAQVSNATTIAPEMYKLDLVTLAPKDKNNRKAHIYYLKHTMEQAAILREIVETSLNH